MTENQGRTTADEMYSSPAPSTIKFNDRFKAPERLFKTRAYAEFIEDCLATPDEEVCGAIAKPKGIDCFGWRRFPNIMSDRHRKEIFSGGSLAARTFADIKRSSESIILCHSHPATVKNAQYFSAVDIAFLRRWRVPGLVAWGDRFTQHTWYDESKFSSFYDRPWRPVENNCYSLVRDYIRSCAGVNLSDRVASLLGDNISSGYEDLHLPGQPKDVIWNVIKKSLKQKNHMDMSQYHSPDLIVFEGKGKWPFHMGICGATGGAGAESGDTVIKFLHQPYGKPSQWSCLGHYWEPVGLFSAMR